MCDSTPLQLAAHNGHARTVELLLKQQCDVNAKDMANYTPLHWAVQKNHPNLIQLLLKYGADPHAKSHGMYLF